MTASIASHTTRTGAGNLQSSDHPHATPESLLVATPVRQRRVTARRPFGPRGTTDRWVNSDRAGLLDDLCCLRLSDDGEVELVEAYRADAPWGRPPGQGQEWTSDEGMRSILGRLAYDV